MTIIKSYFTRIRVGLLWMVLCGIISVNSADGVRCLECHEVAVPSECTHWVTCGHDEECYVREFYNRDMQRGYHMGCELKSRCDLYDRLQAVVGRRAISDCFECCDKDDCNTRLCTTGSITVVNSTNLRCLDCPSVSDPELCDKWSRCEEDEVCFTRAFIDSTGLQMYKMGCEFKQLCSILNTAGGAATTPGPPSCMECCHTEECNAQLCKTGVSTTNTGTITSSSQTASSTPKAPACPPSFTRGDNSCYYFSNTTSAWANANTACEKLGARLAVVETQEKDTGLEYTINNSTLLSQATGYWIGGFYVTATTAWTWVDLHPVTFTKWGPSQPQYTTYSYRLAMLNPAKNSGYKGWSWASVTSSTQYNYICETDAV